MFGAMSRDSGALRKIPYILSDFRRRFVSGIVKYILGGFERRMVRTERGKRRGGEKSQNPHPCTNRKDGAPRRLPPSKTTRTDYDRVRHLPLPPVQLGCATRPLTNDEAEIVRTSRCRENRRMGINGLNNLSKVFVISQGHFATKNNSV